MEISLGSLKRGAEEAQGTTIIIDVFRAFTTAAIAFDRGAKEIVLFADPNDALDLHRKGVGDYLMGEVSGKKPDGWNQPQITTREGAVSASPIRVRAVITVDWPQSLWWMWQDWFRARMRERGEATNSSPTSLGVMP